MQVYFNKIQNTSNQSITKFYYDEKDKLYNNFDFLLDKIKSLIESDKTSESVKKQLIKLVKAPLNKYNCFYIYSNTLCFGIDSKNKIIDFYRNNYDSVIDIESFKNKGYTINFNCKIDSKLQNKIESINASDFE